MSHSDTKSVFTAPWLVTAMLDLVKPETERIDARFIEPACDRGNFLVPVLERKLAAVDARYGRSDTVELASDGPRHTKSTKWRGALEIE